MSRRGLSRKQDRHGLKPLSAGETDHGTLTATGLTLERMDHTRDGDLRRSHATTDNRAGSGLLRLFVLGVVLCSVAVGFLWLEPGLVDRVDEEFSSPEITQEEPPEAGDRDVEEADPNDPGETTYGESTTISSDSVEDHIHEAVNDEREAHGLEPLEWDGTVASVSRAHSHDMAEREYFEHQSPEGTEPWDRFDAVADYCTGYGENIAMTWVDRPVESTDGVADQYDTAGELATGLVEQWLDSPPHREAMLTDSWDRGGVGVTINGDGQVHATHNFCTVSS